MAPSIMDRSATPVEVFPGVLKRTLVRFDEFFGNADALMAAGFLSPEELLPQQGRAEGSTAFLPSGEPCPILVRAWREPGYKAVRRQHDGSLKVQITVSVDERRARQAAHDAACHEEEQELINSAILKRGQEFKNRPLKQGFDRFGEVWEGTKEQLQDAGLGVGMPFPGEPGAPDKLLCKCPLGFDFVVSLPRCDKVKAAAGIYEADSSCLSARDKEKQYLKWAPGVTCENWETRTYAFERDFYHGTAEALVAAGLVPRIALFPGRGGANKIQASYDVGWDRATTCRSARFLATIKKQGKNGLYLLEILVSTDEAARRRSIKDEQEAEAAKFLEQRLEERKTLRKYASDSKVSERDFRLESYNYADTLIRLLKQEIFARADGLLRFDIAEKDLQKSLEDAFQSIRSVIRNAPIVVDRKVQSEARDRLRLAAARNNKGLQSLLTSAQDLMLVRSEDASKKEE